MQLPTHITIIPSPKVKINDEQNNRKAPSLIELLFLIFSIILMVIGCIIIVNKVPTVVISAICEADNPLTNVKNNVSIITKNNKSPEKEENSGYIFIV